MGIVILVVNGSALFVYRLNQEKHRAETEAVRAEQQAKRAETAELEAKSARDEAKSEARKAQAAIANTEEERQHLLQESENFRGTANSFKRQALATTGPVPVGPRRDPKPVPPRSASVPDSVPIIDERNRTLPPNPPPEKANQGFLLAAHSIQPIKGLEGRAAIFIGDLPTVDKPGSIYIVLSRDTSVSVAALREAATNKAVVRDLLNIADGHANPNYPALLFTSFPIPRDANVGNGLDLGGFTVRSIAARFIIILKDYKHSGGSEKISLELKRDQA